MGHTFDNILDQLATYKAGSETLRETILANLVMVGEIAAPTFQEQEKLQFLLQRFSEAGLPDASSDEVGNSVGLIPGKGGDKKNILLVAHADTVFAEEVDHTVTVHPDRVIGPGVGDNSLGVAVLASLSNLIEKLDLEFDSNLILMGASRSLGRGNLEGLRFFLENNTLPIQAAICLEGVQLGRLSITSLGMLRGEITCRVPNEYDGSRFGAAGAIFIMNEVINGLVEIPLPKRPKTSIIMGSIQGGTSFNSIAQSVRLRFEIRSESAQMVRDIRQHVENIIAKVTSETGTEINLDIFAGREPGGLELAHPLAHGTRAIMERLNIESRIAPSMSELTALIDRNIPAVTVGLTWGEHLNEPNESIQVEPISTGIAQLIGILMAVDRGFCHADG
ncbi:MAG: peptidase dimerization domain-containing protein [Kiritimatiellae bacterium]|nr:peptidase dimerization domain-containing protein [Kiritimatiellia bacterium]